MKRTPIAGAASALFLAATLALGGCGGDPASISSPSSQPSSDSVVSSTAAPSSATTSADPTSRPDVEPFVIPDPVTGTYNGKTITMQYAAVSDCVWTNDNLRPYAFFNGYLPFHYYGTESPLDDLIGATYMDKNGKMICDPIYNFVYPFNADGIAVAQKENGSWVYLDITGIEKPAEEKDIEAWSQIDIQYDVPSVKPKDCLSAYVYENKVVVACFGNERKRYGDYSQLFDTNGNLIIETKFERIGNFYQGLAPIVLDGKLGIIDSKGNIVIQPSYKGVYALSDPLFINEDLIVMNSGGKIGIIEIIRSL